MKFIWVMGPSGAGKKTFIVRLMNDADLRVKLNIPDGFVSRGPGINGQSVAITLAKDLALIVAPAVVIKWQAVCDPGEVEGLKALRPDAEHHIFCIRRPPEDIHRDLHKRNPESLETLQGITDFSRNNLDHCRGRARNGFTLTILDASDNDYNPDIGQVL